MDDHLQEFVLKGRLCVILLHSCFGSVLVWHEDLGIKLGIMLADFGWWWLLLGSHLQSREALALMWVEMVVEGEWRCFGGIPGAQQLSLGTAAGISESDHFLLQLHEVQSLLWVIASIALHRQIKSPKSVLHHLTSIRSISAGRAREWAILGLQMKCRDGFGVGQELADRFCCVKGLRIGHLDRVVLVLLFD